MFSLSHRVKTKRDGMGCQAAMNLRQGLVWEGELSDAMKRPAVSPSFRFGVVLVLSFAVCALVKTPHSLCAQSSQTPQCATSDPYAGDLSIFEYPDRDKKLQIERVMDYSGLKRAGALRTHSLYGLRAFLLRR